MFTAEERESVCHRLVNRHASMGPRLFTAEELMRCFAVDRVRHASMGPRLFTAEEYASVRRYVGVAAASMGPRLFTAEEHKGQCEGHKESRASMGPRLFTAEESTARTTFGPVPVLQWGRGCSPRKRWRHAARRPSPSRFNGAAVVHRGRAGTRSTLCRSSTGFNGAAVVHRGREIDQELRHVIVIASMGPRLFTAEEAPRLRTARD